VFQNGSASVTMMISIGVQSLLSMKIMIYSDDR